MQYFRRFAILAVVAIFTTVGNSATAVASTPDTILESGGFVVGGHAQDSNPGSYDYVPSTPAPGTGDRSAKGYAFVPGFTYSFGGATINIPSAQIYHAIDGAGTWIDYERATYTAPARICNYRMDYQNRDLNGKIVGTWSNGTHVGCITGMAGDQGIHRKRVQRGMMCARLFISGAFRGEQCHHIS